MINQIVKLAIVAVIAASASAFAQQAPSKVPVSAPVVPASMCDRKTDAECVGILDRALDKAIDGAFYTKTLGDYADIDAQKDTLEWEIDRLKGRMGAPKLSMTMALSDKLDRLTKELKDREDYLFGHQPKMVVGSNVGMPMVKDVDF